MAAASTSREPHEIPLPSTPNAESQKVKGKGKERASQPEKGRALDSEQWNWFSLSDSSPTKFPPIFTHDARYGLLKLCPYLSHRRLVISFHW